MKKVTKDVLKTVANNLMFDMSDSQYETLLEEFSIITKQMELVGKIPGISEVEPMTFPYATNSTYLREDEVNEPLERDEALKNAKDVVDGQVRLPKVVG